MMRAANVKQYRRKHNLSRIKSDYAYEYHEIASLFVISKSTVRNWVKLGLPVMKAKRPPLINGGELKAFLKARQGIAKRKCQPDELYCLSCKAPRNVWENAVDVRALNSQKLLITGLCVQCENSINKLQPMKNATRIADIFTIQQWHGESIIARMHPHLNCHLQKDETS